METGMQSCNHGSGSLSNKNKSKHSSSCKLNPMQEKNVMVFCIHLLQMVVSSRSFLQFFSPGNSVASSSLLFCSKKEEPT